MGTYIKIGAKIKQAREGLGITQCELAKLLGYQTATSISLIELGARRVTIEALIAISKELKQSIGYFLDENYKGTTLEHALLTDKRFKNLSTASRKEILNFANFIANR